MSIFKETFRDFVFNQLKIREAALNQNSGRLLGRPKVKDFIGEAPTLDAGAFYTNTTSRQCVIRMSSGADLKEDNTLLDANEKEGGNLAGEGLAIRYMLEGGIPAKDVDFINNRGNDKGTPENPIKIIPRGRGTRQFTKGGSKSNQYGSAYGDPYIRSEATDGFGIVPMPGIIDAEIRTKTAYGSLRDAKINFVCHNRRQLDVLDTLYMRPGMPILLEWGWDPYISNKGKRESYFPYLWEWFNQNSSINEINKIIHDRIKAAGGNYDGFVGYVKNFEITSRPDGGYDCTTELAAMGEVLEGLKGKSSGLTIPEEVDGKKLKLEVDNLEYYLNALYNYCEDRRYIEDLTILDNRTDSPEFTLSFSDYNNIQTNIIPLLNKEFKEKTLTDDDFAGVGQKGRTIKNVLNKIENILDEYLLYKQEPLDNSQQDLIQRVGGILPGSRSTEHYIKWDLLALILNNLIFDTYQEGTKISPLTEITWLDEAPNIGPKLPLQYSKYNFKNFTDNQISFYVDNNKVTTPLSDIMDMSIDPSVCLLPHQLDSINTSTVNDQEYNTIKNTTDNRSISDIYISLNHLLKRYKETRYKGDEVNEDFNLLTFLQTIWEKDINNACANTHEFTIHTEKTNSNLVRIIDMQQSELNPKNLYEFKIQGNKSIVRDFNYNTTIDSKLSATVSIASQSPNSISDLDAVSFAAFNKNIKYRFFKEEIEESDANIKRKSELYDKDVKTLKTMLAFLYNHKISILKGDFKDDDNSNLQVSTAKRYIQNVESKIISLKSRYSENDKANNIYRGFRKKTRSNISKSTIIPLKFNCQIDGIGGLVIGNVFKIDSNFLPKGYDGEDVAFAIMTENQKITAGQDWTTDFSGQLILLDLPKFNGEEWDDILWEDTTNSVGSRDKPNIIIQSNVDDKYITRKQQIPDSDVTSIPLGGDIFLKVPNSNVRDSANIDNIGQGTEYIPSIFDFSNNIIGKINGKQGTKLGTVDRQVKEEERTDSIVVTSGDGNIVLSESDKIFLGWGTTIKDGVEYELVDDDKNIETLQDTWRNALTSDNLTSYEGKWHIPKGINWKFEKRIEWNWFLIEFLPSGDEQRKFSFTGDENFVGDTGGNFDGDNWINGNKGWMREDVLCTENYVTPE